MFTKSEFKELRKDVKEALAEVEKKWNISFEPGNISYDNLGFKMQLGATRSDMDVERIKFEQDLIYFPAFTKEDYKCTFTNRKKTLEVIGFKPGNKYSVICREIETKKECVYTYDYVLELLGKK